MKTTAFLILSAALVLTGCSTSRKSTHEQTVSTLSAQTARHLTFTDSLTHTRLAALTVEHPRIILFRPSATDTTVAIFQAARIIATDSAHTISRSETAAVDTLTVTSAATHKASAESRPTPYQNPLWMILALIAGLIIGRSFPGTGSRR